MYLQQKSKKILFRRGEEEKNRSEEELDKESISSPRAIIHIKW
jgi:hypothetical protein